jgi:hypothetical protein
MWILGTKELPDCGVRECFLLKYFCINHLTNYLTNKLITWSRVLLEDLILHSAGQEIPHPLWKPKVHYRVHMSPPQIPIMCHMNPIHTPKPNFRRIHFNIIRPSTPRSSEWSLPFRLFKHIHLPHARYMPRSFILLYLVILIIFDEEYELCSSSLCSFLNPPVTSSLSWAPCSQTSLICILPFTWETT